MATSAQNINGWTVVEAFVRQYGLVRHQIESYDDFILNVIPMILSESEPLVVTASNDIKRTSYPFANPVTIHVPVGPSVSEEKYHVFTFSNPLVTPASLTEYDGSIVPMTPQIARLRNLTYQVSVFFQVQHDIYRKSDKSLISRTCERVLLCQIPLMLKSSLCILRNKSEQELYALGECTNDEGGYFIIKGIERAIMAQEKMINNFIYVFNGDGKRIHSQAKITSSPDGIHKSGSQVIANWINISKTISKKSNLPTYVVHVHLPELCTKKDIPVAILFKALGVTDSKDIVRLCGVAEEHLKSSLEEGFMTITREEALDWISRKNSLHAPTPKQRHDLVIQLIAKHLFPHIGGNSIDQLENKTVFLGLFVNRLINTVIKQREYDDRDHFGNKRVDVTGSLIASLFKQSLHKLFNDFLTQKAFKKLSQNKLMNLHTDFDHCTYISNPILYSFSTGNWTVNKQKINKTGVSQPLMRLSYVAMISHLRKCITPMNKDGKLAKPRQLHTSSWMRIDPNETPEGEGCGLQKHFTLLAHVSLQTRINISKLLLDALLIDYQLTKLPHNFNSSKLLVNGAWIANFEDGKQVASIIRQLRSQNVIPFDTGIVYKTIDNEVCVFTDAGRLCRPVFVVRNRQLLITPDIIRQLHRHTHPVNWLIQQGYVEYIDASEEEELMIALTPEDLVRYKDDYTHCEIDSSLVNGISSNLIPFSDHNPSVRVTYAAQFYKQSMGMYTHNYQHRIDTSAHILFYPQKPIVSTNTSKLIRFDEMPSGHTAVVALACYGGWNCEDSIIVNQSSIDRGMFRSVCYKSYQAEEKKMTGNITEDFCMPDRSETIGYNENNGYHAIDCKDGLPMPGSKVMGGDVLVAKTHSMPTIYDPQGMNASMMSGLPVANSGKMTKKDVSMTVKRTDKGVVDKVMITNNDEVKHSIQDQCNTARNFVRQRFAKIRVRSVRVPELGDKIALTAPQKGTIGLLLRQEDMPYTKDGIVPDVILNPSCLSGDTLVSTCHSLSRRIDSFSEQGNEEVWTFNKTGFVSSRSLGMEYKGEKDVIRLTFFDGKELICTPDHLIQVKTPNGFIFKPAGEIQPNVDDIVMGLEFTEDKHYDDEHNWTLQTDDFVFRMDTETQRNRTLAFARILGFILTDGHLGRERGCSTFNSKIALGQELDVESMMDDIKLVTGNFTLQPSEHWRTVFYVNVTNKLATAIAHLDGMMVGRKTTQEYSLPSFLLDPNCPKAVVREFLGGYFGGDGHAPYVMKHKHSGGQPTATTVHLSKSVCVEYQESLVQNMEHIIRLLDRVGVQAKICRIRPCHVQSELYKEHPRNQVEIEVSSNDDFLRCVGFRHCLQKSARLSIAAAYERFSTKVLSQTTRLLDLVNKLIDENPKVLVSTLLDKARAIQYKEEVPLHTYYSLLNLTYIRNRRRAARKNTPIVIKYEEFPSFEQYIDIIGVKEWFTRTEDGKMNYIVKLGNRYIPNFTMKLLQKQAFGKRGVYDIGVKTHHNFIANGVCAHNCLPSRMTSAQVFETLFGKVGAIKGQSHVDGSVFSTNTEKALDMEKQLKELGFEPHGNEMMYHGATGEMIQAKIFIGINFYMRLKHLVADKAHSRARGKVIPLFRQPTEGRSRDGGFRVGEMEVSALTAHGVACFIKERLFHLSDEYATYFCDRCGFFATANFKKHIFKCGNCDYDKLNKISLPYACKIIFQELMAMGIVPRVRKNPIELKI